MCRVRGFVVCGVVILVLALLVPVMGFAQEAQRSSSSVSFAVLPLDQDVETRRLAQAIASTLLHGDYKVDAPAEVEAQLGVLEVRSVPEEKVERFLELGSKIPDGINAYFYSDASAAIELLQPVVNYVLDTPDVLVQRPDLSSAVYEASVILLRAYGDEGEDAKKEALASLLLLKFPTKRPSTKTAPPEIRDYVEEMSKDVFVRGTALQLESMQEGCTLSINGFSASPSTSYLVMKGETYLVRIDCGVDRPLTWSWRAKDGTGSMLLPVPSRQQHPLNMSGNTPEQRRVAESYVDFVQKSMEVDFVIGVSSLARSSSDGGALLLRQERGKPPLWSDSGQQELITKTLPRLLPEFDLVGNSQGGGVSSSHTRRSRGLIAPSLTLGASVALLGGGTLFAVRGSQELERARCSEANNSRDVSACQGVDGYTYEELGSDAESQQQELAARVSQASMKRNLGIGVGVVGLAGMVGSLVWWKSRHSDSQESEAQFGVSVHPGHAEATVMMRF